MKKKTKKKAPKKADVARRRYVFSKETMSRLKEIQSEVRAECPSIPLTDRMLIEMMATYIQRQFARGDLTVSDFVAPGR